MTRKNGCRLPSPLTHLLYRNTLVGMCTVQHQIRIEVSYKICKAK